MKTIAIVSLALAVTACSDDGVPARLYSSRQGDYFVDWRGQIFKVEGQRMVRVQTGPDPAAPRNVSIDSTLPDTSNTGFPVHVTGTVKVESGVQKVRLLLQLGASGQKKPTPADQTRFVEGIRSGTEKLRTVSLLFYDGDMFTSAPSLQLPLNVGAWTTIVDERGVPTAYSYSNRHQVDGLKSEDIQTIEVQWATRE